MRIGAVDPGVNGCGVCVVDIDCDPPLINEGRLASARYLRGGREEMADWLDFHFNRGDRFRIEFPRIYPAASQKGDQNDLLQLARVVGGIQEAALARGLVVELIYPRDWKGTLDADEMTLRIQGRLTPAEVARVHLPTAKSLAHNVWDAVGIALHAVDRLQPRKVFPR